MSRNNISIEECFSVHWLQWPTSLLTAGGTVNYAYKTLAAVALIPLIYLMRRAIIGYLGAERAAQLRGEAAE